MSDRIIPSAGDEGRLFPMNDHVLEHTGRTELMAGVHYAMHGGTDRWSWRLTNADNGVTVAESPANATYGSRLEAVSTVVALAGTTRLVRLWVATASGDSAPVPMRQVARATTLAELANVIKTAANHDGME